MAYHFLHIIIQVYVIIVVSTLKTVYINSVKLHKFQRYLISTANKRDFGFNKETDLHHPVNNFQMFQNTHEEGIPIKQTTFNIGGGNGGFNGLLNGNDASIPSGGSNWIGHPSSTASLGGVGTSAGANGIGNAMGKGYMPGHTNEENADDETIDQLLKSFQQEDAEGNIYHHWNHENVLRKQPPQMFQR